MQRSAFVSTDKLWLSRISFFWSRQYSCIARFFFFWKIFLHKRPYRFSALRWRWVHLPLRSKQVKNREFPSPGAFCIADRKWWPYLHKRHMNFYWGPVDESVVVEFRSLAQSSSPYKVNGIFELPSFNLRKRYFLMWNDFTLDRFHFVLRLSFKTRKKN